MTSHDLETLAGIGPATAHALVAAGFSDRAAIASATVEQLVAIKGFAEARASALISEAQTSDELEGAAESESRRQTPVEEPIVDGTEHRKERKIRKKLRARHSDLKKRAKKARKKSKTASSKKKRKRWAAEAERLAQKAKKTKKRLARLG